MLTDRPYRSAVSIPEAKRELLAHSGTQFDPAVVKVLMSLEDEKLVIRPEDMYNGGMLHLVAAS